MIQGFIGTPGCGKTTMLSAIAYKEFKSREKGKGRYKYIYSNFYLKGAYKIDINDLGKYYLHDCLILLDEITLDVDSRDYKNFSQRLKEFFILHRHFNIDIVYATQDPSRVDKTIRNITYSLWYVSRPVLPFFRRFVRANRIFRNLNINEYTSELTLGYRFSKFLERLFVTGRCNIIIYSPKYYDLFDSFDDYGNSDKPDFINNSWQA